MSAINRNLFSYLCHILSNSKDNFSLSLQSSCEYPTNSLRTNSAYFVQRAEADGECVKYNFTQLRIHK